MRSLRLSAAMGVPGPYSVVDVDRGDVLLDGRSVAWRAIYLALGTTGLFCRTHPARVYPKRRSHCWRC